MYGTFGIIAYSFSNASVFSKNFHFSSAIPRTIRPDHPQKSLDNPAHVFYIEAIMDDFLLQFTGTLRTVTFAALI